MEKEEPGRYFVEIWIDAGSVDTENTKRDNHLKSPDFFDIERYPTISFKSKSFKKLSDSVYNVTEDMTLHDITRTITVQVQQTGEGKDPWGRYRIGLKQHLQ